MFYASILIDTTFQWICSLRDSTAMSRNKAQVPIKEKTKNVTDKTRSSSISRREAVASKTIAKKNEVSGPARNSSDDKTASRRKPTENSTSLLRDPVNKLSSQKKDDKGREQEGSSKQQKPSTSKPPMAGHPMKDKSSLKSQSDSTVGNKSQRDQAKFVSTSKPSQVTSRTKIKASEQVKASLRNSDKLRSTAERTGGQVKKPNLPVKASYSDSVQIEKHEKTTKQPNAKPETNGDGNRLNRERTKTRTLNPEDSQLMTALQHAAQQLPQDVDPESSADIENEYEDDFEDYESDFEEAPSIEVTSEEETDGELGKTDKEDDNRDDDDDDKENYDYGDSSSSLSDLPSNKDMNPSLNGKTGIEERKMDSGHYDLSEERRFSGKAMSTILDMDRNLSERQQVPLKESSSRVEPRESSTSYNGYEVKAINFARAKKRQQERKASSKLKHRGEILLNMIRLDSVTLPLFDMAPVPYEIYMQSYGRSNTLQISCQTNEDGMEEEMQTDEIYTKNKWTQHPPAFVRPDDSIDHPLICAVSSDPCDSDDVTFWQQGSKVNILELEKFVLNTGQLMLSVLEETSSGNQGIMKSNKVDIGFSQGFIILGTDSVPFLKNRQVSKLCFLPHQPNSLLSVHQSCIEANPKDDLSAQMVKRCILCIWSLQQPSRPLKTLVSSSDVTACTFHPIRKHLLFAGLSDGLVNVWDLKEQTTFQNKVVFEDEEWILKSPSYATVGLGGARHSSAVVGLQVIDSDTDLASKNWERAPTQICSLDEGGLCLLWTVLNAGRSVGDVEDAGDVGMAPWGCVRLLHNEAFSLAPRVAAAASALDDGVTPNLQFADLALDSADSGHLLAAANTGHVVHSLSSGGRAHPALYTPDWDCISPATCLCSCPFGLPYFLVGCADGTVRLHSRHSGRPLLSVAGSGGVVGSGSAIAGLQWSNSRPCVFFVLDCESRLHVWDLAASDMYPVLTVPFKGKKVTSMQLSPSRHPAKACPYLALGTACGKMKVHLVKDSFASTSLEETAVELDKFKRYVAIL